nr:MAG TPA: hypothetical protein [Caudoviricetes sp.]
MAFVFLKKFGKRTEFQRYHNYIQIYVHTAYIMQCISRAEECIKLCAARLGCACVHL